MKNVKNEKKNQKNVFKNLSARSRKIQSALFKRIHPVLWKHMDLEKGKL